MLFIQKKKTKNKIKRNPRWPKSVSNWTEKPKVRAENYMLNWRYMSHALNITKNIILWKFVEAKDE